MTLKLKSPPIVEVVCGFYFAPLPALDPIAVGKYWSRGKSDDYPKTELHPPVAERGGFTVTQGVGPVRSWLISKSDEYVIQIQPDRFYFNWRKRGGAYPEFGETGHGVLSLGMTEFDQFSTFCHQDLGLQPTVTRLELAKVNHIVQGEHWNDFRELSELLPIVGPIMQVTKSGEPLIDLRIVESRRDQDLRCHLTNMLPGASGVQLEIRTSADAANSSLREKFIAANKLANETFFGLVANERLDRFGGIVG